MTGPGSHSQLWAQFRDLASKASGEIASSMGLSHTDICLSLQSGTQGLSELGCDFSWVIMRSPVALRAQPHWCSASVIRQVSPRQEACGSAAKFQPHTSHYKEAGSLSALITVDSKPQAGL